MVDDWEFRRWRGLADGALEMARGGTRHNWRCFLAEQAAQMAGDPADKFTATDAELAIADAELVVAEVDDVWRQLLDARGAGG